MVDLKKPDTAAQLVKAMRALADIRDHAEVYVQKPGGYHKAALAYAGTRADGALKDIEES